MKAGQLLEILKNVDPEFEVVTRIYSEDITSKAQVRVYSKSKYLSVDEGYGKLQMEPPVYSINDKFYDEQGDQLL